MSRETPALPPPALQQKANRQPPRRHRAETELPSATPPKAVIVDPNRPKRPRRQRASKFYAFLVSNFSSNWSTEIGFLVVIKLYCTPKSFTSGCLKRLSGDQAQGLLINWRLPITGVRILRRRRRGKKFFACGAVTSSLCRSGCLLGCTSGVAY